MSHEKSNNDLGSFKFSGADDDTYLIVHNLGDLRPVVEVYNAATNFRIPDDDMTLEVIDINTIEIVITAGVTNIRGTVIGSPDPVE